LGKERVVMGVKKKKKKTRAARVYAVALENTTFRELFPIQGSREN